MSRAACRRVLQRYKDLQDIIAILGMDELSPEDKTHGVPCPQDSAFPEPAVQRRRKCSPGAKANRCPWPKPCAASRKSSKANTSDVAEGNFYMKGGIDEIKAARRPRQIMADTLKLEIVTPEGRRLL